MSSSSSVVRTHSCHCPTPGISEYDLFFCGWSTWVAAIAAHGTADRAERPWSLEAAKYRQAPRMLGMSCTNVHSLASFVLGEANDRNTCQTLAGRGVVLKRNDPPYLSPKQKVVE